MRVPSFKVGKTVVFAFPQRQQEQDVVEKVLDRFDRFLMGFLLVVDDQRGGEEFDTSAQDSSRFIAGDVGRNVVDISSRSSENR